MMVVGAGGVARPSPAGASGATYASRQQFLVVAFGLFGAGGCMTAGDVALQRASKELSCPAEKIGIIERSDIADHVFDMAACGQRARYTCVVHENLPPQCIHEPDPPKWDPDPAAVASLPKPARSGYVRSAGGESRRICGDASTEMSRARIDPISPAGDVACGDCISRDGASEGWRSGCGGQ